MKHIQLRRSVNDGYFNTEWFQYLQPKGAYTATCAVEQDLLPGLDAAFIDQSLHREHCSLRDRRSLFKGHTSGLAAQRILVGADIFSKTTPGTTEVSEHFITWIESSHVFADRLYPARYVGSE